VVLGNFEMILGLKVNFTKSNIYGINVSTKFLSATAEFLYCKIGTVPFTYLGLPVGANHMHLLTWQPLKNSFHKKLSSWKNRFLSIGGKVVLLNMVLNSLPSLTLSFMKLPKKVISKITQIQRPILWVGVSLTK